MATFSFDIVSEYDKAEMNNVYAAAEKEIGSRYDFKGTPAAIDWLGDKTGFVITGANQWQCDAVLDIVRKKLASRNQSAKVLDTSGTPRESNLKTTWELPFRHGLSQDMAKTIAKQLRDNAVKVKAQIQGEAVRVSSGSKDELQNVIAIVKAADYDTPLQFINYR